MASLCKSVGSLLNVAVSVRPRQRPLPPEPHHVELAAALWEMLQDEDSQNREEFNNIVNFLTVAPPEVDLSRAVYFFALVVKEMLESEGSDERHYADELLMRVTERMRCAKKNTRLRACELLQAVVQGLPEGFELTESVAAEIQEGLFDRLADVDWQVRLEAIKGVERFQCHPQEGVPMDKITECLLEMAKCDKMAKVRASALDGLPIMEEVVGLILERTQDQAVYVQAMAYNILAVKVDPREIDMKKRMEVATYILQDSSNPLFGLVDKMIQSWYTKWLDKDPILFLELLDVAGCEQASEDIIKHMLSSGVISPDVLESALEKDQEVWGGNFLDEKWVFFWQVACCWMKSKWRKGPENRDIEQEAEIESLVELLDRVLPSVDVLTGCIRKHCGIEAFFQARQMIEVTTHCVNLSDASHRKAVEQLVKQLLEIDGDDIWYEKVVLLGKSAWPATLDFMLNMLEALEMSLLDATKSLSTCRCLLQVLKNLPRGIDIPKHYFDLFEKLVDVLVSIVDSDESPVSAAALAVETLSLYSIVFGPGNKSLTKVLNCLKSEEEILQTRALQGLTDIAITYGLASVDNITTNFQNANFMELVGAYMPGREADSDGDDSENENMISNLEIQAVKSLCQLVYLEHWKSQEKSKSKGMNFLIQFIVMQCNGQAHNIPEVEQMLDLFFEKFASQSVQSQRDLQAAFLPAVYKCLEFTASSSPACQAINLVTNLLFIPVADGSGESRQVTEGHAQLACLLLWEYVKGSNSTSEKSYYSALWKTISSLKLEKCTVDEAPVFASLVEHWSRQGALQEGKAEGLKSKVAELLTGTEQLDNEEIETVLGNIAAHMNKASKLDMDTSFNVFSFSPTTCEVQNDKEGEEEDGVNGDNIEM